MRVNGYRPGAGAENIGPYLNLALDMPFGAASCCGRVAPGRLLPGAPTDPDVRDSRIRLFETRVRYAGRAAAGVSSG